MQQNTSDTGFPILTTRDTATVSASACGYKYAVSMQQNTCYGIWPTPVATVAQSACSEPLDTLQQILALVMAIVTQWASNATTVTLLLCNTVLMLPLWVAVHFQMPSCKLMDGVHRWCCSQG